MWQIIISALSNSARLVSTQRWLQKLPYSQEQSVFSAAACQPHMSHSVWTNCDSCVLPHTMAVLRAIPLNSWEGSVHSAQTTGEVAQRVAHTHSLSAAAGGSSDKLS